MTETPFDFRNPPPGELERQIAGWLTAASRRAAANWADRLCYAAELKPGPVLPTTAAAAWRAIPEPAVGFSATIPAAPDSQLLLVLPRPLLLGLIAGLLGETPTALPADRDPTDLETSLLGYVAEDLFLDPLAKGWPLSDAPRFALGSSGFPRAVWRGSGSEQVLAAPLTVATPFGEHPAALLMSRPGPWAKLAERPSQAPDSPFDRTQIEDAVRGMAVELTVILGTAETTMADLAELRAGDLVVLRQKIGEPLDGLVCGARKFRLWPGAVGARAAVRVHNTVHE